MRSIITADPNRCRMWSLHDRCAEQVDARSCKAEIDSFAAYGQIVPVLGRRINGDPDIEIELIYGARRLFAARYLKMPLLVEVREITDAEGLVAMSIENQQRQDISPYERGLSYKRWLHSGQFESQDDISRTLNISASQVSRLLHLARLPAVVVSAFREPSDIRENWGLELMNALNDPQRRAATLRSARSISNNSPRPRARDVIRKLLASPARGRRPKLKSHDKVVCGQDGEALFRVKYLNQSIALVFRAERLSDNKRAAVESALTAILQGAKTPPVRLRKRRRPTAEITATVPLDLGPA